MLFSLCSDGNMEGKMKGKITLLLFSVFLLQECCLDAALRTKKKSIRRLWRINLTCKSVKLFITNLSN